MSFSRSHLSYYEVTTPLVYERGRGRGGLTFGGYQRQGETENKYKYNGVERSADLDIGLDLMVFRTYDPAIGRFNQVDPLSDIIGGISPYNFGFNNPIRYADPLGLMGSDSTQQRGADGLTNDQWMENSRNVLVGGRDRSREINRENNLAEAREYRRKKNDIGSVSGELVVGGGDGSDNELFRILEKESNRVHVFYGNKYEAGVFDWEVVNNIATAVTIEEIVITRAMTSSVGDWLRSGKKVSPSSLKLLNNVSKGANFLGSVVIGARIENGYYSHRNGTEKPLEAAGDVMFNAIGYTGVGTPFSLAYFLGVKPLMKSYTNRIQNDPTFRRLEFIKATSGDPRYGGAK
jgi:RHS repeat-associated protein